MLIILWTNRALWNSQQQCPRLTRRLFYRPRRTCQQSQFRRCTTVISLLISRARWSSRSHSPLPEMSRERMRARLCTTISLGLKKRALWSSLLLIRKLQTPFSRIRRQMCLRLRVQDCTWAATLPLTTPARWISPLMRRLRTPLSSMARSLAEMFQHIWLQGFLVNVRFSTVPRR